MDFEKEFAKVSEGDGANYFKPTEGTAKITFEDDGLQDVAHFKNKETGVDEEKERVTFAIKVDDKPFAWSVFPPNKVPYGKNSLYAQILKCGKVWGGLKGKTITLISMGNGMKRRYTVLEAQDNGVNITESTISK